LLCKTGLLNGLATGARDMVGLDKSRTSFSSQVFYSLGTEIFRSLTLTGSVITSSFFAPHAQYYVYTTA